MSTSNIDVVKACFSAFGSRNVTAVANDEATVNPTRELRLPAVRGKRDRVASPDEAARLIAAVPDKDRAVWAVAFYAGLRLGELRALEWESVDLAAGTIRVTRSWDQVAGPIKPKSEAGTRTVPIPTVLRDFLTPHKLKAGRHAGLVFPGRHGGQPFGHWSLQERADKAWEAAGLNRLTLHEARHTFASLMIAAGVDAKALSDFMGHSSIQVTFDKYGHLMPGSGAEAAALLDAYLERSVTG